MSNSNLQNKYNDYLKIKSKLKNFEPLNDFKFEVNLYIFDKLKDIETNPENQKHNKKVFSFFESRILNDVKYSFIKSEWNSYCKKESVNLDYTKSFLSDFITHLEQKIGNEEAVKQELNHSSFKREASQIAQTLVDRIFDLSKTDDQLYQSIKALAEMTPNKLAQPKKKTTTKRNK